MKIAIAVSGGVDSLYALISLKEAGHDVAALHARFIPTEDDPVPSLSALCKKLEVPFHVANLQDEFAQKVIIPFLQAYSLGETPNPCALCNRSMKLGRLLDIARNLSAEKMATGHYANLQEYVFDGVSYGLSLKIGEDTAKDQSYFLALTPLVQLRRCLFPMAHKLKKDIYGELEKYSINIPIEKESQEVCFVPNDNYREFIENKARQYNVEYPASGKIIGIENDGDSFKETYITEHQGLWRYTEGQRKGLGIAWKEPLYVIKKDVENNTLFVGNKQCLSISSAFAKDINFLVPPSLWPQKLYARTRFREAVSPVSIHLKDLDTNQSYSFDSSADMQQLILAESSLLNNLEKNTQSESFELESKLYHVREEELLYSEEEKKLFDKINGWNNANLQIQIDFHQEKQVYAKGQILAVYDENGFVLAGAVLC